MTLNVLLSFAQFEREVIGERIPDKIAASKRNGMWMGGVPPFGYRVEDHKLVVVGSEVEIVRLIFRRYAELGCGREVRMVDRTDPFALLAHSRLPLAWQDQRTLLGFA